MSLMRRELDKAFAGTLTELHLTRVITLLNALAMGRSSREVAPFNLLYRVGKCFITNHCSTQAAVHAGADILYQFERLGVLHMVENGFLIDDPDAIRNLWLELDDKVAGTRPRRQPLSPWSCNRHLNGDLLVSGEGKQYITAAAQPLVFQRVNAAQKVGWCINEAILEVATDEFSLKGAGFEDIWTIASSKAQDSKVRETKTILRLAHEYKGSPFYHSYYLDFRGRIYPRTSYLHEQGCDLTRGLLLRAEKKRISTSGFNWLFISLANNWAGSVTGSEIKSDKLPLYDRIKWAASKEETFLAYANSPLRYRGWVKADKPWQFLAACNELKRIRNWEAQGNKVEDYETGLEVSIDGTTNGSQHIAALLRDEDLAVHVNLVPAVECGDLYSYVADNVWERINAHYATLDEPYRVTLRLENARLQAAVARMHSAASREDREIAYEAFKALRDEVKDHEEDLAVVFWFQVTNRKERRKIVKRNVMTLSYGVTRYGMISQQMEDARKHGIPHIRDLSRPHATYMGLAVYQHSGMAASMRLLETFREAGACSEYLAWTVPGTNFPVRQRYKTYPMGTVNILYGGTPMSVRVPLRESCKANQVKQASGAAPNIIHSLDAAHLVMTAQRCADLGVTITTIHDCFASHLADMPLLFREVREAFVDLYRENPLHGILEEIEVIDFDIKVGELDINAVLDSEYAFS